jgi:hypothetical protein
LTESKREIAEYLAGMYNPEALFADGFDEAIIGFHTGQGLVVYSEQKIIAALIRDDEMTWEDAYEHFSYNIAGSYVGPNTPLIVQEIE